ncbi:MAG: Asp23/Gls24 family envelope stress response protein [Anaerovoracaceae bacterium]|nr:Asp23/Gls24 family envelope stress response protein [Bacillota bacterium]MDY2670026.1 Asp23/Gls24 family envelope stress response protein [Anaerovoracaceae bacterium]
MIEYETERGQVRFADQIFAMIALEAAKNTEGLYALTNAKGKIMKARQTGRESLGFIEVSSDSGAVDLRLYGIIRFGSSISGTAEILGRKIRSMIKDITGAETGRIMFTLTGVKSKKIARRELDILC